MGAALEGRTSEGRKPLTLEPQSCPDPALEPPVYLRWWGRAEERDGDKDGLP